MRDGRATYRLWRARARVAFLSSRAPAARTGASAHYSRWWALSARLPEVLELPERLRVGCGGACHRIVSGDELRAVAPIVPQYRGGFVSSCGWLRHRPGGVGLRPERAGVTGPWGRRLRGTRGPARSREQLWGAKECTQIGENDLSESFWGICVHCCAVVGRRGDAGVYTDRRKRPLGVVLGHLCTLLRREGRTSCDASRVGWHECPNHHGVPVASPRWPPLAW